VSPFVTAKSNLCSTTTHSVTYDTSAEYAFTVTAGATATANYLATQAAQCPDQQFILSGYSKGALVVHREYQAQLLCLNQLSAMYMIRNYLAECYKVQDPRYLGLW
jgi:hypothetical protein